MLAVNFIRLGFGWWPCHCQNANELQTTSSDQVQSPHHSWNEARRFPKGLGEGWDRQEVEGINMVQKTWSHREGNFKLPGRKASPKRDVYIGLTKTLVLLRVGNIWLILSGLRVNARNYTTKSCKWCILILVWISTKEDFKMLLIWLQEFVPNLLCDPYV